MDADKGRDALEKNLRVLVGLVLQHFTVLQVTVTATYSSITSPSEITD